MPKIHPMSVVDPAARLADDVEVGPFCVVGPHVEIGEGTRLISHVTVTGHTTIGRRNVIGQGTVLGSDPQDLKWKREPTRLVIGDGNSIREYVTMHLGTVQDKVSGGVTRVGNGNLIMVGVHVGHDCVIGNNTIIANNTMLAGHVHVGDYSAIQGGVGVSHFVSIGEYSFVAGMARISIDVPPFVKVDEFGRMVALNKVRLSRCGYPKEAVAELTTAVRKLVRRKRAMSTSIREFQDHAANNGGIHPDVLKLVSFIERRSGVKNGRWLESMRGA